MDAMMMNMVPGKAAMPTVKGGSASQAGSGAKESFSQYMDRKLSADNQKKSLLGAKSRQSSRPASSDKNTDAKSAKDDDAESSAAQNVAALLQQFLEKLQELAKNGETKPGEWSLNVPDNGVLQKIAADAGMDAKAFSALLAQCRKKDGTIGLQDFLAALANHFQQQGQKITVPETDLPAVETLLSKLGVPVEQMVDATSKSVGGDGKVDLAALLQALKQVDDSGQTTTLSQWDTEQLRNLLTDAGVSDQLRDNLLPASQSDTPAPFSLARLQEMLRQAIGEVQDNQPQVKPDAFLQDLHQVLADAGFASKGVGWQPVVEGAVAANYQEVVKSVDLATMRVNKAADADKSGASQQAEGEPGQTLGDLLTAAEEKMAARVEARKTLAAEAAKAAGKEGAGVGDGSADGSAGQLTGGVDSAAHDAVLGAANAAAQHQTMTNTGSELVAPVRDAAPPPLPPQLAQQTFDQIAGEVTRGLKNDEHHLVLRLFPKELGEVKVDMMVRENHVSINFAMENSRVKQTLESNMQQFQDNLAKQGFVLNGCQVSVGQQQQDPGSAWQFFEQARQQLGLGDGGRRETLADLPGDTMYIRPLRGASHEGGISLLI